MSARTETPDPLGLVGVTLDGQYEVGPVVGEGGFGVVYRGHHRGLDQPIAIKVLKVLSADDRRLQEAMFVKFREEAKLLYSLSQTSLNIVRAIDFGAMTTPTGFWAPYMVLEWLKGRSLADDVARRRAQGLRGRSLDEAMAILEPMAEGLGVAHHRRIAHRDVKPANVFLVDTDRGPRVKVLDFGIAKLVQEGETPATKSAFASFTWLYAAPEQLDPRLGPTGLATDVYAFALVVTELLTDRPPVDARDVVGIMKASTDPIIRPSPRQRGANVPEAFELACRRALAVDPRARFGSVPELFEALVAARGGASAGHIPAVAPSPPHPGALGPPRWAPPPGVRALPPATWPGRPVPDAGGSAVVWLAVVGVALSMMLVGACTIVHSCAN